MPTLLGGLMIGLSLGLLGSGGSILTVPVLAYALGHAERLAVAESLVIVGGIALLGSARYVLTRRVCWRSVLLFGVPGMAGTYLGAAAASLVSGTTQLLAFGAVMLAAAVFMARPPSEREAAPSRPSAAPLIVLEGAVVGAVTGFVGVGGGFLIVPALVFLRGLPIHRAIGTSLVIIALKSAVGFVKYAEILRVEQLAIEWVTVGLFVGLGAVGATLGSRLNHRLNPRALRRVFAVFLVVMATFILVREGRAVLAAAPEDPARAAARATRAVDAG